MVYTQPRIRPRKWDTQTPLGFSNINWSRNLGQTIRPNNSLQKENFSIPADHSVKLNESEKDKYLHIVRELKKTVKETVIPIVISVLGAVT